MIKTAHLRVYRPALRSPFAALPVAGRVRRAPFAGPYGIVGETQTEDVLLAQWGDRSWLCPRTPRLRVLEGVLAIRRAYRELGPVGGVVPEEIAAMARRELEALHEGRPGVRAHILTSAWHVPIRWFVPFDPKAKEIFGRDGGAGVRYRVEHPEAMARVERAASVLSSSEMPESVTSEVRELATWLTDFPPDSMIELDYGSVAGMFSESDLILDESVADVWAALDALDHGNWKRAGDRYGSVVARWAAPMAVAYSN
jgi:hypothetical protein